MAKLSNLRMSIFYLQQALREDDVKDDKDLLEALNIMAEVDTKLYNKEQDETL